MDYKEKYLKSRLTDLANSFKAIANISAYTTKINNYKIVKKQYDELKNIADEANLLVKEFCSEEICEKINNGEVDDLPEYLQPMKTIDTYKKILAFKYSSMYVSKKEETFAINKMSIDFDSSSELPLLNILGTLYGDKKYAEVLKLGTLWLEYYDNVTIIEYIARAYKNLGEKGKAIDYFRKYLAKYDEDDYIQKDLDKLYKECFK